MWGVLNGGCPEPKKLSLLTFGLAGGRSEQGADGIPLGAAGGGELGQGVWQGRLPRDLHQHNCHL